MKRVVRIFLHFPAVFVVWSVFSVFVLKYIPVQWTPLMLKREIQFADDPNYRRVQEWISLSEISRDALSVIILSEDSRFWQHKGADVKELVYMIRAYRRGDAQLRGCSTISQQVAKNCFTFCSDSFLRKTVELYWTGLIEIIWGKERILEVYLNVAEMGPGIFGIEAAAQKYFHCTAKELSLYEGAALAVCMPEPLHKSPATAWENESGRIRKLIAKMVAVPL